MPILYDRNGQGYRFSPADKSLIREKLNRGWSTEPRAPRHIPSKQVQLQKETQPETIQVAINQATEDQLQKIQGVGVAVAKKIVEAQPIEDVGALLDIAPKVPWVKPISKKGEPIILAF